VKPIDKFLVEIRNNLEALIRVAKRRSPYSGESDKYLEVAKICLNDVIDKEITETFVVDPNVVNNQIDFT